MIKKEKKNTRRDFLKKSATTATGVVLGMNAIGAPAIQSALGANDSRTLMSRPATISLVSHPRLPRKEPDRLNKALKQMGDYIEQAAQLKSDMIAFPELVTGSEPEPVDGPTITEMSRKAREHEIYVVCPLATLENGQRYNSSVLIGRDGSIDGIYHKNFPTHGELNRGTIPGTETPVFETDFGRVGLTICFDLNYWEVGSSLCKNKAELVIWSSMWEGSRMLTRWAIEFGFYMGASYANRSTIVDVVGREIISLSRNVYDRTDGVAAPIVTATIDMDRQLLHHDGNIGRLKPIYEKYGGNSVYAEWLPEECLLIFGSQMQGISTDQLIEEFSLETMRDYLARVRRDRKRVLEGTYGTYQPARKK